MSVAHQFIGFHQLKSQIGLTKNCVKDKGKLTKYLLVEDEVLKIYP
jgi:hypothetical protein